MTFTGDAKKWRQHCRGCSILIGFSYQTVLTFHWFNFGSLKYSAELFIVARKMRRITRRSDDNLLPCTAIVCNEPVYERVPYESASLMKLVCPAKRRVFCFVCFPAGWSCRRGHFIREQEFRRTYPSPDQSKLPSLPSASCCLCHRRDNTHRLWEGTPR